MLFLFCEICGNVHDGSISNGRYCSLSCSRKAHANSFLIDSEKHEQNNSILIEHYDNFKNTDSIKKVPGFIRYAADKFGNIYHICCMKTLKPFNSNGYYQVCLFDNNDNKIVKGVHQIIAMTFCDNFFDGCVVHHIDENKHNNCIDNLEVSTRSSHSRHHADASCLVAYVKENGPANKGKLMSDEFRQHCRDSAINRWSKK